MAGWSERRPCAAARDYLPHHLEPLLRRLHIDRTVLVQAAPTIAETEFLLDLAADDAVIAAVVGWVDFEDRTTSGISSASRAIRNSPASAR